MKNSIINHCISDLETSSFSGSQPEMEVIHLPLPDDIVPDSARGDIGVIGNYSLY